MASEVWFTIHNTGCELTADLKLMLVQVQVLGGYSLTSVILMS